MDLEGSGKDVVYYNEVDVPVGQLVLELEEPIDSGQKRLWVTPHVFRVLGQDFPQLFGLLVGNLFDDHARVLSVVHEAATLAF